MRALIQRVSRARVETAGETIGSIGPGLVVLVCAMQGDTEVQSVKLAQKICNLRIFKDDDGKMNRSVTAVGGDALVVSQFTLAGDTSRGNRPGFSAAAAPDTGQMLYDHFVDEMKKSGIRVETGSFGADMAVSLTNDGPVTLWLDI